MTTTSTCRAPGRAARPALRPGATTGSPVVTDETTAPPAVALVRWPQDDHERRRLADARVPRLLLVDPAAPPPHPWGIDEDWVRLPADPEDVRLRVGMLSRRTGAPLPDPTGEPSTGVERAIR